MIPIPNSLINHTTSKLNRNVISEFLKLSKGDFFVIDSSLSTIHRLNQLGFSDDFKSTDKLIEVIANIYDDLYIDNNYLVGKDRDLTVPLLKIKI